MAILEWVTDAETLRSKKPRPRKSQRQKPLRQSKNRLLKWKKPGNSETTDESAEDDDAEAVEEETEATEEAAEEEARRKTRTRSPNKLLL